MRGPLRDKGRLMDLLAIVGLAALGAEMWYLHFFTPEGADPWLFRGGFLLTSIATLFVIGAVTHRGSLAGPVLGNPVFLWVGVRSYGMYLYHWPIYQVIRRVAGNALTVPQFVVAMVATLIVTEASFRYIEMPIRRGVVGIWWRNLRRARDPVPRQLVTVAFGTCLALSIFGVFSLARADLQQNEIQDSIEQGSEAAGDVGRPREPDGATRIRNHCTSHRHDRLAGNGRGLGARAADDYYHQHDHYVSASDRTGPIPRDRRLGDARRSS